jgi:hypothetical protein
MRIPSLFILIICSCIITPQAPLQASTLSFDGTSAFSFLEAQCDFGTRPPGSENLSQCRSYIADTIEAFGWDVVLQNFTYRGVECANIIANGVAENVSIILGAHYDTRPHANMDPVEENKLLPVMGANDGASGTAVLMELARILPASARNNIELVFFDAEDSGGIDGWPYIVGSNYYVDQLILTNTSNIMAMILVDMVGDDNLILERELYSTRSLQDTIWSIAAALGYDHIFVDVNGGHIIDDHYPFVEKTDIPTLDIIQHSPFPATWHTIHDIPERCSSDSLAVVGRVLEYFLSNNTEWTDGFIPNQDYTIQIILVGVGLIVVLTVVVFVKYKR